MRSGWIVGFGLVGLAPAAVALAVGCTHGGGQPGPPDDAGRDTVVTDVTPADVIADAGADIDQDPNTYPADHQPIPQIDYLGGEVLKAPKIVTVTFTGDVHRDSLRSFDHVLVTTSYWSDVMAGYCVDDAGNCVGQGTAVAPDGGYWKPDGSTADGGDGYYDVELAYDFASNSIQDQDIRTWLGQHVGAGDFPAPDAQSLYVIYFPAAITISSGSGSSCADFLGYHGSTQIGGQEVAYAVIPLCSTGSPQMDFDYLTTTTSHEVGEAASNPHPGAQPAFYLVSNDAWLGAFTAGGGECGDMCWQGYIDSEDTYNESGWTVQRIWSNLAAAQSRNPCQPTSTAYFAAAVRTQKLNVHGHDSYGYVEVSRGKSVDVIADVFSEKALPHDLLLYAGKDKGQSALPSDMSPPPNGITVELSRMQVHNGSGVVVTIGVPSDAQTGDYRFVVRAILETNDYNDWPVLVHVQ
jgi:hypothetical protein